MRGFLGGFSAAGGGGCGGNAVAVWGGGVFSESLAGVLGAENETAGAPKGLYGFMHKTMEECGDQCRVRGV